MKLTSNYICNYTQTHPHTHVNTYKYTKHAPYIYGILKKQNNKMCVCFLINILFT